MAEAAPKVTDQGIAMFMSRESTKRALGYSDRGWCFDYRGPRVPAAGLDLLREAACLAADLPLMAAAGGVRRVPLPVAGPGGPTAWAVCWAPGASTPVQGYEDWSLSFVVLGCLSETRYRLIEPGVADREGEGRIRSGTVVARGVGARSVHRLANETAWFALSVHVLGPQARGPFAVDRVLPPHMCVDEMFL
jgi:hypothetical protein